MSAFDKLGSLAIPFVKAFGLFTWEMARGLLIALVLCLVIDIITMPKLWAALQGPGMPASAHAGILGAVLGLVFLMLIPEGFLTVMLLAVVPVVYVVVVQKRAISRALHSLIQGHGAAFYDATLGRFIQSKAGDSKSWAQWVAKPNSFATALNQYLQERENWPRFARKLACRFASGWVEKSQLSGVVSDGKLAEAEQIRAVAIEHMQDAMVPSWKGLLILLAVHMGLAAAALFVV
jgi:hypothetical protein